MQIEQFKIQVPDEVLDDLNQRLASVRWPEQKEGSGWQRGTDKDFLQELVTYWRNGYDWRARERELNQYKQFKCEVDGVNIHFIYEKGTGSQPKPLIFTHGWPDSFLRYQKIIRMLTDPASFGGDPDEAFDVIIPSLPGFGFSSGPQHGAYDNSRVADLWFRLMTEKLGYQKFGAAGGDIGSGVTRYLALQHPECLTGIHLTDVGIIRALLTVADETSLSPAELNYKKSAQQWLGQEGGYMNIQSTKPQTLAYGLSDSPVGLAAWLIEKYRSWSDCSGRLEEKFSKDELLTNIMICWVTNSIGSSVQMYYENVHSLPPMGRISVPTALAIFPQDILLPPKEWAEKNLNMMRWTEMSSGGHFTAMEEAAQYADDVRQFFLNS
jgi:pimeloyl-ACP methyl ester carboxylesterase